MKKSTKVLIILGAAIIIGLLGMVIFLSFEVNAAKAILPTATLFPTATKKPTAIPTKKPTATPSITIEEAQIYVYLTTTKKNMDKCSESLNIVVENMVQNIIDPTLIKDKNYKEEINKEINDFRDHCTNLSPNNFPEILTECDDYLSKAEEMFELAADNYALGINNNDLGKLENFNENLNQAISYLTLAKNELDRVVELID